MMNFLTQPQVPLDPRLNIAPQPFVVGDYAKKKRLAEALRAKASRPYDQLAPIGQAEGANGVPGEVYINWGNIISNAAQPWIQGRNEDRAAVADDEAAAARREALGRITGDMSPEQMMQAGEELGMPGLQEAALEQMMPQKLNLAQRAQSSTSKAGLMALLQMGQISQEQFDQAVSNLDSEEAAKLKRKQEDYLFRERNQVFAPTAGTGGGSGSTSGPSELTPGLLQLYGKELSGVKDQYSALRDTRKSLDAMDELIYGKVGKDGKRIKSSSALGPMTALLATGSEMGVPMMQYAQNPAARQLETLINNQILNEASKLKGALSDKDLAFLSKSLQSLKDNPESAAAIYEGVKSRLEGAEGRLLSTRKGMVDMDERLGGFWLDPTTGQEEASSQKADTPQKAETPEERKARLKSLL